MIQDRWITAEDYSLLDMSLAVDEFHKGTTPEFFYAPGSVCKVYEDDKGPVMFVRGTKSLRLDIQFVDNNDSERNREVMLSQFEKFAEIAKQNGFTELIFCTNSPALKVFCKRRFKFKEVDGELRRLL